MHDAAWGLLGDVEVVRASTDSDGNQLPARASSPSLSADGTKVAFALIQIDPVTFNPTGVQQLYVKDLTTGQLSLVSSNAAGEAGDKGAARPIISSDGTKVFFISGSSNLVTDDTNGTGGVFVKDLMSGDVTLVAPGAIGSMFAVSNDGSLVAFGSKSNDLVPGDNNSTTERTFSSRTCRPDKSRSSRQPKMETLRRDRPSRRSSPPMARKSASSRLPTTWCRESAVSRST